MTASAMTESCQRWMQLETDTLMIPVKAGETIYFGAMVSTDWTGYAVPAADVANHVFEGIAISERDVNGVAQPPSASIDNSGGASGDTYVMVQRHGRIRIHCHQTPVQAMMSATVYVRNDNCISANQWDVANDIVCGRVSRVTWPGKAANSDLIEVEFECGICAPQGREHPTSTTRGG